MALLTAKQVASLGVPLLQRNLSLANTVARIAGGDFDGRNGATVTIAVPVPAASRVQAAAGADITYDDLSEVGVDVTLSHLYHGKLVSDEELSFTIEQFGVQVTRPQVAAVATGIENELATVMNDLPADASFALSATTEDTAAQVVSVVQTLDENDVPDDGDRFLAVSPAIAARMYRVPEFVKVNESGSDQTLRRGTIGEILGLTVVKSNALTAGTAVGYHRSGFAMANRTAASYSGDAVDSAAVVEQGIALRQIFQYEAGKLSRASVVSSFGGASLVDADRVVKLDTAIS